MQLIGNGPNRGGTQPCEPPTGHESHAAAYVPDAEAFAQRLILAQLTDDDDGEGWWATYEEFDACPRCVCNVVGQLVAIAAEALSTSSECHADNCVVCAAEDDREPPRAVDDITRRA